MNSREAAVAELERRIGYQFNDTVSAVAGYRALGVNYRNDGFVFDTVQQGPILGLTVKF